MQRSLLTLILILSGFPGIINFSTGQGHIVNYFHNRNQIFSFNSEPKPFLNYSEEDSYLGIDNEDFTIDLGNSIKSTIEENKILSNSPMNYFLGDAENYIQKILHPFQLDLPPPAIV